MVTDVILEGQEIFLQPFCLEDATEDYCRWLNTTEVVQYTESRFQKMTIEDIRQYIQRETAAPDKIFFAIIYKGQNRHIGNIKIHGINTTHRHAEVSLLIGKPSVWGRGIGSEAIRLVRDYACSDLNLHKLFAKCYANNVGSLKAFHKAGFDEEGILKQHYRLEGRYIDGIHLGLVNNRGSVHGA